ncbi:MAG: hypothetical protein HXS46_15065 [Theionarchaea archaeon]|nr:hypothetical protein [Theionarchaea archaeon]
MADNYELTDESVVTFHDLYRGQEEDGFILVGRQDIGSYVSIPADALEVIDLLSAGKTIGETEHILEEKYGEEVEIREFIQDLLDNEMVRSVNGSAIATTSKAQKDLFSGITQEHVGWMFSKGAWVIYTGMAVVCVVIFAVYPNYIPQPVDYFFHPLYSVAVGFMFFCGWILVAIHELAHLFAAKSVRTEGYFSLGHRLVFLVAQTNLGNIWTIPRNKRYTVYLAGMAWDTVAIFICLLLILGSDYNVITLAPLWYNFLKAIVFIKVWGIIWQFRFNMQTDVYYTVANYFRCKNLLGDAKTYIKNFLSRFIKRIEPRDMSNMPDHEMSAVKWYSVFYFVGTSVTLATYFLRTIPLLLLQVRKALDGLLAGYAASPVDFADSVILIVLNTISYGLLGYVLLRSQWSSIRSQWSGIKQWFHAAFA